MNNIIESTANAAGISLADATFLRWYEITNALSHDHINALFSLFQRAVESEIRRSGNPDIPTTVYIRTFREVTAKVASRHTCRRFDSALADSEECAA